MAIQYPDFIADACGTLPDPFNVSGSNDQLSVTIDAGSPQVFTLTHGSARTAANIVSDLSGLTGATASVVNVGGMNVIRIRTTSANGNSSSILVNAPTNNANALLGFTATTYFGGSYVSYFFNSSVKQDVINGIETALLSAGWITISGHATTALKMQSSMTPPAQNLRMRIKVQDNAGVGVQVNCYNAFENLGGINQSAFPGGNSLNPVAGRPYQIIANKHQAWILTPGAGTGCDFTCFGTPWIPSFLSGTIFEAWFQNGNSQSDNSSQNNSFRTGLGTLSNAYRANLINRSFWESDFNPSQTGDQALFGNSGLQHTGPASYRWHDRSSIMCDALISWGQSGQSDEGMIRGQLWNAFISSDFYQQDEQITGVDSHTWQAVSYSQPALMMLVA